MNSQGFPVCCGGKILTGFGNTTTAIDGTKYTKEQVDKFLTEQERYRGTGLMTAILNEEQIKAVGSVFKKHGWLFGKPGYHPSHRTWLRLVYKPGEPTSEASPKAKTLAELL